MTKQIDFVPQGNPTTEALKLSIAIQLLSTRIQTMEVTFQQDPDHYSTEDWEDFITACKFLNDVGRKNLTVWKDVEAYLAKAYAQMSKRYDNYLTR